MASKTNVNKDGIPTGAYSRWSVLERVQGVSERERRPVWDTFFVFSKPIKPT